MQVKIKFCIFFLFTLLILLTSSKVIINNNYLEIPNEKHESFYLSFEELKKNYNLQIQNISSQSVCIDVKNKIINRHHLRWIFEGVRIKFLQSVYDIFKSKKILNYSFAGIIFLSLFFSFYLPIFSNEKRITETFNKIKINDLLIIFIFFCSSLSLFAFREVSEIRFSIFEMFFFSFGIFFAIKKVFILYLLFCILAVLNRESGIILSFLWFIFNGINFKGYLFQINFNIKHLLKSIFAFSICAVIFFIANKEIFACGYVFELFMHKDVQGSRIFEVELSLENINSFFINFLYFFFILYFFWVGSNRQIQILLIILIFNLVFLIFTPLNHSILRIILIPLLTLYFIHYVKFNNDGKKLT